MPLDGEGNQLSELYLDGKADAAFGYFPVRSDDEYLKGYCAGLKELPLDEKGRIIQPSPSRKFAFGFVDGDAGEY